MPRKNPKTTQRKQSSPRRNLKPNNIKGNLPGSLTAFTTGNKHKNGGIDIPAYNAEVEKGETKVGSYIFSDSKDMKLTKSLAKEYGIPEKYTGKTFAQASKEIQNKYGERENDPYTENAMNREVKDLHDAQEDKRKEKAIEALEKFRSLMGKSGEDIMKHGGDLSSKISKLVDEGYDQDQAVAIAHDMQERGELEDGGDLIDMLGQYEKGGHLVKANETEGDQPKYPVNSADDVRDAWKLRNHAKGLKISQETLNKRIKNAAKRYGVDLGDDDKKEHGGELEYEKGGETITPYERQNMGPEGPDEGEVREKKIDNTATSTLGSINPLLGMAYKAGSYAGDQIAEESTLEEGDSTKERLKKGVTSSVVDPAENLKDNINKHGAAEGAGRHLVEFSSMGLVSGDQVFDKGGNMRKYLHGGDAGDGENDDIDWEKRYREDPRFGTSNTTSRPMDQRQPYEPMSPAQQRAVRRRRENPQGFENQGAPGQPGTLEGDNNFRDYGFDSSLSTMQKIAPFIKPAVGAATMIGGPEEVDYERMSPEKVDYEESRDIARRQANLAEARAEENIRKNANSAGQLLQGNIAANIGSQKNLTNALMKSRMREQNKNVQIANRAERINRQIERMEEQAQAKNRARFEQNLTNIAGDVSRGIQGLERDRKRYQSQNRFNRAYFDMMNQRFPNYSYLPREDEDTENPRYIPEHRRGGE